MRLKKSVKNLRKFQIDVDLSLYRCQFDWINDELPQVIDKMFQDMTDVKIQFNTVRDYNEVKAATVTKEPNQTTKVHMS